MIGLQILDRKQVEQVEHVEQAHLHLRNPRVSRVMPLFHLSGDRWNTWNKLTCTQEVRSTCYNCAADRWNIQGNTKKREKPPFWTVCSTCTPCSTLF